VSLRDHRVAALFASALALSCSASPDPVGTGGTASESGSSTSSEGTITGDTTGVDASGGPTESSGGNETGTATCTLVDAWELVDDFVKVPTEDAKALGVGGDEDGNVFALGSSEDPVAMTSTWIVRRSADAGASWETVDEYSMPDGAMATAGSVAAFEGTIFVLGSATDGAGDAHRIVRRSADAGASWETVDDFLYAAGFSTYAGGIGVAPDGTLYAAGQAGSVDGPRWTVRASEDGGDTWTTVSDFQYAAGQVCVPVGLAVDAAGDAYASGNCNDAAMTSHWIVQRGRSQGAWTVVDDFIGDAGGGSFARQPSARERVLVAGGGTPQDSPQHWIVRRGEVGGRAWATIDDYAPVPERANATSAYDDGAGTLVAIGNVSEDAPSTPTRMVTRRSTDDGETWATIDEFDYVGEAVYGGSLRADAAGNLYASAIAYDTDGRQHWIVRKLACE
jgi:hypothetical protein